MLYFRRQFDFPLRILCLNLPSEVNVNKKRPVNLELLTIKFPIMAICSILHRLSGLLLFVLIPVALYGLALSLGSEPGFLKVQTFLSQPAFKLSLLTAIAALLYHLLAGIRHMLMDMGLGEHVAAAKVSAFLLLLIVATLVLLVGVRLW